MKSIMTAVGIACILISAGPLAAQGSSVDEQIDAAIQRGVAQIWSTQRPNGMFSDNEPNKWADTYKYPGDTEVMAMLALAYAGEDPEKNPKMRRSLKTLLELKMEKTYTLGFRLVTLAELYRRADDKNLKAGLRQAMQRDVAVLLDIQHEHGGWYYDKIADTAEWDFSNTQIAVLGLYEAARCGVEVPPLAFQRALALYLQRQLADGGWNYGRPGLSKSKPSYGSMTAAAVASLFICREVLNPGQGCPCRGERSAGRRDSNVDKAIRTGTQWLGERFVVNSNPVKGRAWFYYWFYAAERVGIYTGLKYFGAHNWYREGAGAILRRQRPDGSWGSFSDTSFALLFLVKGRGPILVNKLMYDGSWDLHPNDAAHLAQFVGKIKEQQINWQVIHLDIPVEEMHDAPILYITAEEAVEFSDEHKQKLREYTDTGGTLFVEASCGNRAAATWWEKLCQELWPEWELKVITKEHPLWGADLKVGPRVPVLRGLDDGVRTFLFYSPRDVSCKWHAQSVARDVALFNMGNNLYAYATDRGKLRGRLSEREVGTGRKYAGQTPAYSGTERQLTVARLQHGGLWHATQHYRPWTLLGEDLKAGTGLEIAERDPIPAGQDIPREVGLAYLSGRGRPTMSDEAVKRLKTYLAGGGFLFAEAAIGDPHFDEGFRELAAAAGLKLKTLGADDPVIGGSIPGGATGYAAPSVGYTFALRPQRIGRPLPLLYGITLAGSDRLVGIYSPYDIMYSQTGCKAFGSRGYEADDARALATNIALFAAGR